MNRTVQIWMRRLWPLVVISGMLVASNFVPSYELSRGPKARQQGIEQSELTCAMAPNTSGNRLRLVKSRAATDVSAGSITRRLHKVKGSSFIKEFAPTTTGVAIAVGNDAIGNADAFMLASGKSTLFRGWLGQQCQQPDTSWWFIGAAASFGRSDLIILTNPLTSVAYVDIDAFTPQGVVHNADSRGIRVNPRTRRVLAMSRLFPGIAQSALHVTTTGGRIHAGVLLSSFTTTGTGAEWLPATEPGAQVIPIPPDLDKASLFIAAPTAAAQISVTAAGAGGSFTPVGMESASVSAGGVVALSANGIAPDASSLNVSSDVPVVAGVVGRVLRRGAKSGDFIATAGVAPSLSRARTLIGGKDTSTRLVLLSSQKMQTQVEVTVSGAPTPWHKSVTIPPQSSTTVLLPSRLMPSAVTIKAKSGAFATTLSWRAKGTDMLPATDIALLPQATTVLVRPAVQTVR